MTEQPFEPKLLVDWRAAVIAGALAGTIFLLIVLIGMPLIYGVSAAIPLRYIASIVMGESVLPPPATLTPVVVIVSVLVHYIFSILFATVLAYITHRWGFVAGIVVGALFGLAIYGINIYTMTLIYPWFFVLNTPTFLISHVLFGAVAGGIYEAIEVERYVPAKAVQ